jgi:hypothetical protein
MLLLVGDRHAASLQDPHQRLSLAFDFARGFALGFASVVRPAVRFAEELLDLGFHGQCLSRGFAQGFLDQEGV